MAGEKLLLKVYGGKEESTLDQLRIKRFYQKISTSMKYVQPECLNPTSAAASYHSLCVYHQVQIWKGQELDPTQWGWHVKNRKLMPVYTSKDPAPSNLLKIIKCGCKTDCRKRTCTCHKYGLNRSLLCGECRGVSCLNCQDHKDIDDDNDIELLEYDK